MVDPDHHPLDTPLGIIHEAAVTLAYLAGRCPTPELRDHLHAVAVQVAEAYEQVQKYALSTID